jgi:hypothetical protein
MPARPSAANGNRVELVTACGRDCRPQGGMRLPELTDQLEQIGVGNKVDLSIDRRGNMMSVSLDIADVGSAR